MADTESLAVYTVVKVGVVITVGLGEQAILNTVVLGLQIGRGMRRTRACHQSVPGGRRCAHMPKCTSINGKSRA